MNEVQTFNNQEFGEVRTVEINGEPWFVASDIAKVLGYRMASDLTRRIDEEDRGMQIMRTPGGDQTMTVINESGLYCAILNSNLPSAKNFKRWITSEVIPSIRRNGGYIMSQNNLTPEQIVANALVVAQNIIQQRDRQIEEMKPKADYFDALVDRKLNLSFRETAKQIGVGEKQFITFLIDNKYIFRDQKEQLQPYARFNKTLFETKEYTSHHSSHAGTQTLVTPKGRETFRLLLCRDKEA